MFTAITHSQIYVLDQDEALDFYAGKLGLEVAADVDMGDMRWLTVAVPGHPERQIVLAKPGGPMMSAQTAEQVRDLVTKGAGGTVIFTTDDCRKTCETLRERGVEIIEEPTERPFGIDCALRDPFGNHIRFTQLS
ncbi:glyoxalase [Actinorhabdospora filicis]|uniref:Glyoxalase n=1 Tax=Actinorhabdospora filicis TaxID=1785913 RepID=A0A9W6SLY5_9ACTN|nr:VOC family protein [Actinorhabdospora filicis]GLZ79379.1 glyoxalase [Actinorhabdospora filicis]